MQPWYVECWTKIHPRLLPKKKICSNLQLRQNYTMKSRPVLRYTLLSMVYSTLFKKKMVHGGIWLIQTVCSNLIILDGGDLKLETDGVNMANSMVQMTIDTDGADFLFLNSKLETRNLENSGIMKKWTRNSEPWTRQWKNELET